MYETLIVPVDVSNADKAAVMLDTAERLGGKSGKIVLVNIIEAIPSYVAVQIPAEVGERVKAAAIEELSRIAKSTTLDTEIEVRSGHASQGILTVADEKNADAIIIASHRPSFEDYLLGSTASRVVRHANCSVVVVR
ncbi:MAG: universal stress protein [Hyphomicrobiaceae bacterium]